MRICKYAGNDCNKYYAKSMCRFHYHREYMGKSAANPKRIRHANKGFECSFDGCDRDAHTFGLCHTHDVQMRDRGELSEIGSRPLGNPPITDPCSVSGCAGRASDAGKCPKHYQAYNRGRLEPIELEKQCKLPHCIGKASQSSLCHKHNNQSRRFGLSLEQMIDLYADFSCQICKKVGEGREMHIDHDHACCEVYPLCGQCVRGLLCRPCNMGIGFLRDDTDTIKSALVYLESSKTKGHG